MRSLEFTQNHGGFRRDQLCFLVLRQRTLKKQEPNISCKPQRPSANLLQFASENGHRKYIEKMIKTMIYPLKMVSKTMTDP